MTKDNITKMIKENYKIIIPFALMLVLFISFFVYYKVMIADNYTKDETIEVFQYFYEKKYDYNLKVSKNRRDVIVDIAPQDIKVEYDSTPIYSKNSDAFKFNKSSSLFLSLPPISFKLCSIYFHLSYL